jgi:hypothetical protein
MKLFVKLYCSRTNCSSPPNFVRKKKWVNGNKCPKKHERDEPMKEPFTDEEPHRKYRIRPRGKIPSLGNYGNRYA